MKTLTVIALVFLSFEVSFAQETPLPPLVATDSVNSEVLSIIPSESAYFDVSAAFVDRLATSNAAADVLELEGWREIGVDCDTGPEFTRFSCISCLEDDNKKKLKELYERLRDTTKQLVDVHESSLKQEEEKLAAIATKLNATADGRKWLALQPEIEKLVGQISKLKRSRTSDPKELRTARSNLAMARGELLLVEASLEMLPKDYNDQKTKVSEAKIKLDDAKSDLERYEEYLTQLSGMSSCGVMNDPEVLNLQAD